MTSLLMRSLKKQVGGGVMDIEKDSNREAFEDWYCKYHTGLKQSDKVVKAQEPTND